MVFTLTFVVLITFWLVLSGNFDAFHITLGIIATLIITFWSGNLLIQQRGKSIGSRIAESLKCISYLFWLLFQIVKANIHVLLLALSPNIKKSLDPRVFTFKTKLKQEFSKFVFANSITLTPGTVTIMINDDEFLVHAITPKAAGDLPGEMEKKVAQIFENE